MDFFILRYCSAQVVIKFKKLSNHGGIWYKVRLPHITHIVTNCNSGLNADNTHLYIEGEVDNLKQEAPKLKKVKRSTYLKLHRNGFSGLACHS